MGHEVLAAVLHDVGKIGVRDNILLKEGRLTEEEFIGIDGGDRVVECGRVSNAFRELTELVKAPPTGKTSDIVDVEILEIT